MLRKCLIVVFNVMIKAYGIGGQFKEACSLFDSMEKHGFVADRCGCNTLVHMFASADLPENAVIYLRKMQEAGLVIDCAPYCAVISSYAKLGRIEVAVELYEEMISHDAKPDIIVYEVLIDAFANSGSVDEATYYVCTMRNSGLSMNPTICNSLIKLYSERYMVAEAVATFREMLESCVVPDDSTFTSLGIIC